MSTPSPRLSEVLSTRVANRLSRVGFATEHDLTEAIKRYGLADDGSGDYQLYAREAPYIAYFGPISWKEVLDYLDEKGFDWKKHLVPRRYYPRDDVDKMHSTELLLRVERAMVHLQIMLNRLASLLVEEREL